jgi:hypothetical protein
MVWLAVRVFHVAGVAEHQRGIADSQFGMANAALGVFKAEHLDRAEGLLVELDGLGGVVDAEVGVMLCWPSGMGLTAMLRLSCAWRRCARW